MAEELCSYQWTGKWSAEVGTRMPVEVPHFCTEPAGHIGRHVCHCGLQSSSGIGAPNARIGLLCQYSPEPSDMTMSAVCPQCGHMLAAHVGEECCPVCVLVWQGTEMYQRQQARVHGASWPR